MLIFKDNSYLNNNKLTSKLTNVHQQGLVLLLGIRIIIVTQFSLIIAHLHYLLKNIIMVYFIINP